VQMKTARIILYAVAAAAALSCIKDPSERTIYKGSGLGYPVKTVDLESGAGSLDVAVIATRSYAISTEADWVRVPETGAEGKEGFSLSYGANNGLPRKGLVVVSIEETNHRDTLTLRQKGVKEPTLGADSPVVLLPGSKGGSQSVKLNTNIPDSDFVLDWYCEGGEDWITDVKLSSGTISFSYNANPLQQMRRASASVSYTDAFGTAYRQDFQISQLSSSDSAGRELTFPQLFAMATEEGADLSEDLTVEGIVVSDKASGNAGAPRQIGLTSIDYDVAWSTLYLEALDGSAGIRVQMRTPQDNSFLQGDKLKMNLNGATLYRSAVIDPETDPVYYYITGAKGNMAIECEHLGREGIPHKEKRIAELSDRDIFTYVTIPDCELPVRKGSLTPISEKYTSATGANKITKFPILLRDITGASMYVYTNVTCPYRRDGKAAPQGSGPMSGVLVHELYPRFCYMDSSSADSETWGNIGRYQLRHTSREDFGMKATMSGSFSEIICEWRYITAKNLERYYATDGDTKAYFTYSFVYPDAKPYSEDGRAGKLPIITASDWSYLGPSGIDATGNENGLGIILADGSDWMSPFWTGAGSSLAASVNKNGYGEVPSDAGSAWATNLTARNGKPQYTTFVFSTEGISSGSMSMQISSMNRFYSSTQKINGVATYLEGPRYWWVEYSLDGNNWTQLARYSLPEICQDSPVTQLWQTPGFKAINIALPAGELLGKEKVYVRLIPDAALQTGTQSAYLDPSIIYPDSGSFPTAWNYIGFRYNRTEGPSTGDSGRSIDPLNPVQYTW